MIVTYECKTQLMVIKNKIFWYLIYNGKFYYLQRRYKDLVQ